jgi:hypothetical protein
MSIFEKYAKLRELYPDDIDHIEAEEADLKRLLARQEYSQLPVTQELLAHCRKEIVAAKLKLSATRNLSEEARAELWHIIDARLWFVEMVAKDYQGELRQIEQMLDIELSRI